MQKTIDAIFENGVFKPIKRITMPERTRLKLIVLKENKDAERIAKEQADALMSIAGIGSSGLRDVSENPEKYLYGTRKK